MSAFQNNDGTHLLQTEFNIDMIWTMYKWNRDLYKRNVDETGCRGYITVNHRAPALLHRQSPPLL